MSRPRSEFLRRRWRWFPTAALLALTPKCLLCLLAYAGLGAALGLTGPEICGAPIDSHGSWTASLALSGIALGVTGALANFRGRRRQCDGSTAGLTEDSGF